MSESKCVQGKVLFVDDEQSILNSLRRLAMSRKWDVDTALSGDEALACAAVKDYDVIVSDMRMPKMTGAELLIEMKKHHSKTLRVLLTGYSDISALETVVNEAGIYNYITKPWNDTVLVDVIEGGFRYAEGERERERLQQLTKTQNQKIGKMALLLEKRLKESTIETEQALTLLSMQHHQTKRNALESLSVVSQIIDWKEGRDSGHSKFVEGYSQKIAESIGMEEHQVEELRIAASLHRIGLLSLSSDLSNKAPYEFSQEEREQYNNYPQLGEVALSRSELLKSIGKIVRSHKEYVNGQGFPDGLIVNDIPKESLIIGMVGDFYDVYNGRRERNISGFEAAKTYINQWKGKHYDTELVEVFLNVLEDFVEGSEQKKIVNASQLIEGQVLVEDLISEKGVLLLSHGTEMTEENISQLRLHEESTGGELSILVIESIEDQESR